MPLGSAITGVFDDVPTNTAYPYIRIGEETVSDNSSKDKDIFDHTYDHIWSQYRGNRDIKEIMKQIHDLLHDSSLTVSGASMVNMRQEFHTTITEADGITRAWCHAISCRCVRQLVKEIWTWRHKKAQTYL